MSSSILEGHVYLTVKDSCLSVARIGDNKVSIIKSLEPGLFFEVGDIIRGPLDELGWARIDLWRAMTSYRSILVTVLSTGPLGIGYKPAFLRKKYRS